MVLGASCVKEKNCKNYREGTLVICEQIYTNKGKKIIGKIFPEQYTRTKSSVHVDVDDGILKSYKKGDTVYVGITCTKPVQLAIYPDIIKITCIEKINPK